MPGVTGKSFVNVVLALVSVAVCACGNSSAPGSADVGRGNLTAAGATFPEPFYSRAFFAYSQSYPQVTVNYQAVGSGAGIEQFIKGTVDFGASDVPMQNADITAAGGPGSLVQIPTTLGVVAIAYNLSGVSRLQLDGQGILDRQDVAVENRHQLIGAQRQPEPAAGGIR